MGAGDGPGSLTFRHDDLNATTRAVKTAAGVLRGWYIGNNSASPVFVQFYDATTTAVSAAGFTLPKLTLMVPSNGAANLNLGEERIPFATAITAACVTAATSSASISPATNVCVATILYG